MEEWSGKSRDEVRDSLAECLKSNQTEVVAAFDLAVKQLGPISMNSEGELFRPNG